MKKTILLFTLLGLFFFAFPAYAGIVSLKWPGTQHFEKVTEGATPAAPYLALYALSGTDDFYKKNASGDTSCFIDSISFATVETDILALQASMATAEANISTLETSMATVEASIATAEADISTLETYTLTTNPTTISPTSGASTNTVTMPSHFLNPTQALTMASTPTIPDGSATGQTVMFMFTGANQIILQDETDLPGSNLRLGGADVTLDAYDVIRLIFDGTYWRKLFKTDL